MENICPPLYHSIYYYYLPTYIGTYVQTDCHSMRSSVGKPGEKGVLTSMKKIMCFVGGSQNHSLPRQHSGRLLFKGGFYFNCKVSSKIQLNLCTHNTFNTKVIVFEIISNIEKNIQPIKVIRTFTQYNPEQVRKLLLIVSVSFF